MSRRSSTMDPPKSLVEGQRLDQPTFHALYEGMPPGTRAELVGGVVLIPGPIGQEHGRAQVPVIVWLDYFAEHTPGVEVLGHATAMLGWRSEPEPDALLRILPEYGGCSRDDGAYIRGAPELVVEVAKATRYIDLGPKLADYEQAGVLEYVVRTIDPDEVYLFRQHQGTLVEQAVGEDGLYRLESFPGLWLDPRALIDGDTRRLRAAVDLGVATAEHAEFVARLVAAQAPDGLTVAR